MQDNVPTVDAYVVELVQRAGFISLGKTNTPEFGLSSYTDNDVVGPARTPWDLTRNAGGSSGGAAAAVAARLVPLAEGSDGGGSIRIPASCCGIVGFKPSRGRVSAGPLGSDWSGLAGDGALARTVRDAAALLDAMAHPMPGDLRPLPEPDVSFSAWAAREPRRLRIARWSTPYLPGIETSASSIDAWEEASRLLESLGHDVVDVDNPFPAAARATVQRRVVERHGRGAGARRGDRDAAGQHPLLAGPRPGGQCSGAGPRHPVPRGHHARGRDDDARVRRLADTRRSRCHRSRRSGSPSRATRPRTTAASCCSPRSPPSTTWPASLRRACRCTGPKRRRTPRRCRSASCSPDARAGTARFLAAQPGRGGRAVGGAASAVSW